jgi:hypothetical protein
MTMVVRMFSTLTDAQRAVSDLMQSGYARNAISILVRDALAHRMPRCQDPGEHGLLARATNIIAGGPLGDALHRRHATVGQRAVTDCLETAGLQQSAARFFAEAICHGAIVVAVHCRDRDGDVACAREILDVHHAAGPESLDARSIH